MLRLWVYHQHEDPAVIFKTDFKSKLEDGWKDSPMKCEGFLHRVNVDPKDAQSVQVTGEITSDLVDLLNGGLNVQMMTKKQLEVFSQRHFKVRLAKRKLVAVLRDEVSEMIKAKKEGSS